jgi:DNA invertase Pin-like site-specific DNA recombinase
MLIGYARVSTQDQNLELQREALSKAGCKKVFEDKVSGTRADRPGLAKTLEMLREGDTLVVWKLDRLGRSVKQLVDLVGDLHKHGVQFRSLTDSIDTGTPSGRFFFHVMASLAEMERELTVERTRAGLEVAKQLGRKAASRPDRRRRLALALEAIRQITGGLHYDQPGSERVEGRSRPAPPRRSASLPPGRGRPPGRSRG